MRFPWFIVLFSAIGIMLVTWHLLTKHMDFMTPTNAALPPEDYGDDLAVGAPVMQPKIVKGPKIDLPTQPVEPEEPIVSEISDEDLGDLESIPGLDEYRSFARNNPALRLLDLSSTLQARGDFQRALIALERIVDTSENPSPEEISQATEGIASLAPTLPRWSVDPETETELILLISGSKGASDTLKAAALDVATLIRKHSGDQLQIIPKVERLGSSLSTADTTSLAISFQREISKEKASTATLMIRGGGENEGEHYIKAVFRSVRGHLAAQGYPFPENFDIPAKDLLTLHITRLMWRDFAESLVPKKDEKPADQ
ncbi:hypothetical protein N9139_01510 [Akkermansiaceae bacterium]|nr:hypothetical protein [Akkermansiaceae bacterium]